MGERTALIEAREARGFNRPHFAEAMRASRHYIYDVEMGRRDPSFEYMLRWVAVLGPGATLELFRPSKTQPQRRYNKQRLPARRSRCAPAGAAE